MINLFFLVFINIFFYRLAEYGTDRIGSILVILIFIILLFLINNKQKLFKGEFKELFKFLIIIGSILISIKSFYLIYFTLILILFYYTHLKNELLNFFQKQNFSISHNFYNINFFIILLNSGCFIFPAQFTCIETVDGQCQKKKLKM